MISHYFFKCSSSPGKQVAPCPPIVVDEQPPVNPSPEVIIQTNPDGSLIDLKDYLASELTTDQQQLFMTSTWMYLNRQGECCIDLEHAMKWMGVTEKDKQKKKLVENCTEGLDFKLLNRPAAEQKGRGGHNKQTILLTPDTFKDLCMMTGTPEGKEARQYFRTMETIVKKYVLTQAAFEKQQHQIQLEQQTRLLEQQAAQTRIQLEEQTRALQAKEDELQQQAKELERYKKKTYEPVEKNGNPKLLEQIVHYILNRYRQEPKREFFDCDLDFIKMVISLAGETIDTLKSCYEHISTDALITKVNENLGTTISDIPKKSNNAVTNFINDAFKFGAELTIHQKYLRLAYDEWKRETGDTIGAVDNKFKTFYDKMETVLTARQGVKKCEVRMKGVQNPTTGYKGMGLRQEYFDKLVPKSM
ncbi:hypothetical protein HK102_009186 [Quaeritorhiza haematococci]|nr:hypothetical protein HK102_009186 [Quaeritorhiza haematococci]